MADWDAELPADGCWTLRGENVAKWQSNCTRYVLHQCRQPGSPAWSDQENWKDSARRSPVGAKTTTNGRSKSMKKNKHIGSTLESLLEEDGTLVEADAAALKRVLAWQVQQAMAEKKLTRSAMAREMRTSRTVVARLLDPRDQAVTLRTLVKAADVLDKRIRLELAEGLPECDRVTGVTGILSKRLDTDAVMAQLRGRRAHKSSVARTTR
jgi:antitoxin HicB